MVRMFGSEAFIVEELSLIRRGLVLNTPLEDMLTKLAERSGSRYIEQFSRVFEIAKRSGGNMSEVIRSSAELIGRDIDAKAEMETVLSGRRMEQNIMKIVPFVIVIYIDISNKGYFDSLYGNMKGIIIMTVCLGIYIAAYFMGDKVIGKLETEI